MHVSNQSFHVPMLESNQSFKSIISREKAFSRLMMCFKGITFWFFSLFRSGDDYDNCLLSDEAYSSIDIYSQLDYDLLWNVYVLTSDNNCYNVNYASSKFFKNILKSLLKAKPTYTSFCGCLKKKKH